MFKLFGRSRANEKQINLMCIDIVTLKNELEKLIRTNSYLEKRINKTNCDHSEQRVDISGENFFIVCQECDTQLLRTRIIDSNMLEQKIIMNKNVLKILEARKKKGNGK